MFVALGGPKGYEQVTIRESTRIPGTNKKKTVIIEKKGKLKDLLAEDPNYLEKLKAEVKEKTQLQKAKLKPIQIFVPVGEIKAETEAAPLLNFGHCLVKKLWTMMGLDEFFDKECSAKNKDDILSGLYCLVAHRLTEPNSVRKIHKKSSQYAGMENVTLDVLYSILDVFANKQEALITHLSNYFQKHTERNLDIVSYDVTNYYFESTMAGELRLFGFSKEHKNNEVIVVMGLLIDSNGIPVTFRLFPGNVMDQNTLEDSISNLQQLYGFKEITVVTDRGMNENLIYLSENGHHFVISYTLKKASGELKDLCLDNTTEWDEERFDEDGAVVYQARMVKSKAKAKISLTPEELEAEKEARKIKPKCGALPKYKTVEVDVNIHVTYSKARAKKDAEDRERALKKLRSKLNRPGALKASLRYGVNQYLKTDEMDVSKLVIDESKVAEAQRFDGYYAVVTDRLDLTTAEAMTIYKGQWKIEESFRILKTNLEARPAYVWTDNHIQGHFTLCYLALCMVRYLQYLLEHDKNIDESFSVERIMDAINSPQVLIQGIYPQIVATPTMVTKDYLTISRALGFKNMLQNMTMTQFKAVTKLDLKHNVKAI